ncbi:complexed with Cdc5 protein Cwf12 [Schizosaccharomyces japonicus yFS275]|uniref:Complexed with Cdc5 protein Cwf12 n=1 Tax=Schizosaccharomyces japonicus (strain yFS275 / FY16936) TaxID=402676 RepID=B6K025_SCHJY|nr:complexed with Cdc5 protein Cwf12 [Schizosaccharomyces japonicus yFS275]EEB06175.1 complexed with Cdc5 protein Cwf12 [Schizosaccharomyces japonicus yFS275]
MSSYKKSSEYKPGERRPRNVSTVNSVPVCENYRSSVVKEIARRINRIQNPVLPEYQIRDLNDAINKLMREKRAWELQIKELGGPDYTHVSTAKLFDDEGQKVSEEDEYRYYGRARDLPGVKELFETDITFVSEHQRKLEMQQRVLNADYYGYLTESEEAKLLEFEKQAEQSRLVELQRSAVDQQPPADWQRVRIGRIPNKTEVEQILLQRRKDALLSRLD